MPDDEYTPSTAEVFELAYYGALEVTSDLNREEFKAMIIRWIEGLTRNPSRALSDIETLNLSLWTEDSCR